MRELMTSAPRAFLGRSSVTRLAWILVCCSWLIDATNASATEWKFELTFSSSVRSEPYTGRVYVIFAKTQAPPRFALNWFDTAPVMSLDVVNWKPDEPLELSAGTKGLLSFPARLQDVTLEGMKAQGLIRFSPLEDELGTGAGNGFSQEVTIEKSADVAAPIRLHVDRLIPPSPFRDTKWAKLIEVRSRLLSDFHHRDVVLRGAVVLPASHYDAPARRYPVMFTIPGFSGTHKMGQRSDPVPERNAQGVEFIRVFLDPSCPLGHHVFADSENNGPYGTAFVTEFLPEFERRFRTIPAPTARFVTGHSSGGWSSLWLQVSHPDLFGGTWSTAPDPVDFRSFQRIDLYRPGENMYVDPEGAPRPIARSGDRVLIRYKDFASREWVLGNGGQLHSFEVVFSRKGDDGHPQLLWDRQTGVIDTDVAKTWEKYDIRLVLERNWETLGPKLQGKIHVFTGELDTFYLNGATRLLKQSLATLKSDAIVELVPGADHSTLLRPELVTRIRREMVERFLKHHDWPE